MSDYPDHDVFARHVGESFGLRLASGERVAVELVEAKALSTRAGADVPSARQQPFSLLFVAPGGADLPQATYRIEHETLGLLDIFLVPIGRDEKGVILEAVFA